MLGKYGDQILETIEATIKEHYKTDKNGSSSNESNDSAKRSRDTKMVLQMRMQTMTTSLEARRSKKRTVKRQNQDGEAYCSKDPEDYNNNQCPADDNLDFDDYDVESNCPEVSVDLNGLGRVLPSWSRT